MFLPLILSIALASETVSAPKSVQATAGLPHCVDDAKEVGAIRDKMKANKSNPSKYEGYRSALISDSDDELRARLVYAETLAANCLAKNDEVSRLINEVISNRVKKRAGNVRSVVFERDQFASSLNIYDESRYADFLCPKDLKLWRRIMALAEGTTTSLGPSAVHYFLYKHSPRWTKEPWKMPEEKPAGGRDVRDCIRVFKNERWK